MADGEIDVVTVDPHALRAAIEAVPGRVAWLPDTIRHNLLALTADAESAYGLYLRGADGEQGPYQFASATAYQPAGSGAGWRDEAVGSTVAANNYLGEIASSWPGPVLLIPYAAQTYARQGWRRGATRATTDEAQGVDLTDREVALVDDYGGRHELWLAAAGLAAVTAAYALYRSSYAILRVIAALAIAAAVSAAVLILLGRLWRAGWWQASAPGAQRYEPPAPAPAGDDPYPPAGV